MARLNSMIPVPTILIPAIESFCGALFHPRLQGCVCVCACVCACVCVCVKRSERERDDSGMQKVKHACLKRAGIWPWCQFLKSVFISARLQSCQLFFSLPLALPAFCTSFSILQCNAHATCGELEQTAGLTP